MRDMSISHWLQSGLSSRNGLIRKGTAALLAVPKSIRSWRADAGNLTPRPPVLANAFPKSGTHLLAQVVEGFPDRVNYGAFLASQTSSFQLRERTPQNTCRFIRGFVPGEIIRGHLYFHPLYAEELNRRHAVHYFIYRDPRDVVVSEAHYLREMNRWHRLHPYFKRASTMVDAIMLSITGLDPPVPGIYYPDIAARFSRYIGWLERDDCLAIRFEEFVSDRQPTVIRQIAEFYAMRTGAALDVQECVERMSRLIAPQRSHTFRSGKTAGWQREFTADHRRRFDEIAGNLLIRLRYEPNHAWANEPIAASV